MKLVVVRHLGGHDVGRRWDKMDTYRYAELLTRLWPVGFLGAAAALIFWRSKKTAEADTPQEAIQETAKTTLFGYGGSTLLDLVGLGDVANQASTTVFGPVVLFAETASGAISNAGGSILNLFGVGDG